jgi:hypothetical protein
MQAVHPLAPGSAKDWLANSAKARSNAMCDFLTRRVNHTFDLLDKLGATDEQLAFLAQ